MTDNEQRAHDLALEYARVEYSNHVASILNNNINVNSCFDFFKVYKAAYVLLLEECSKEFSND